MKTITVGNRTITLGDPQKPEDIRTPEEMYQLLLDHNDKCVLDLEAYNPGQFHKEDDAAFKCTECGHTFTWQIASYMTNADWHGTGCDKCHKKNVAEEEARNPDPRSPEEQLASLMDPYTGRPMFETGAVFTKDVLGVEED